MDRSARQGGEAKTGAGAYLTKMVMRDPTKVLMNQFLRAVCEWGCGEHLPQARRMAATSMEGRLPEFCDLMDAVQNCTQCGVEIHTLEQRVRDKFLLGDVKIQGKPKEKGN